MTCDDCIYAKWQLKRNGARIKGKAGVCTAPYVLDDAPASVRMSFNFREKPHRSAIWMGDPIGNCPAYVKKGTDE